MHHASIVALQAAPKKKTAPRNTAGKAQKKHAAVDDGPLPDVVLLSNIRLMLEVVRGTSTKNGAQT